MQTALAKLKTDQIIQEIQAIQVTEPCLPPSLESLLKATEWKPLRGRSFLPEVAGIITFGVQAAARERADILQKTYDARPCEGKTSASLARLFLGFPIQNLPAAEAKIRSEIYVKVLSGMPNAAIETACTRWLSADCGTENMRYSPSPPQIVYEARKARDEATECIIALREIGKANIPSLPVPGRNSQERPVMRERVLKMMQETVAALKVSSDDEKKKPRDITPASMHAELYALADDPQSKVNRKNEAAV